MCARASPVQRNFNLPTVTCMKKRVSSSLRRGRVVRRDDAPRINSLLSSVRMCLERSCDPRALPTSESVRREEACHAINLCIECRYPRARSSWRHLNGASVIGKISNKRFEVLSLPPFFLTVRGPPWIPKMLLSMRSRHVRIFRGQFCGARSTTLFGAARG